MSLILNFTVKQLRAINRNCINLRVPNRTLTKLQDDDFTLEFLEGDRKGIISRVINLDSVTILWLVRFDD